MPMARNEAVKTRPAGRPPPTENKQKVTIGGRTDEEDIKTKVDPGICMKTKGEGQNDRRKSGHFCIVEAHFPKPESLFVPICNPFALFAASECTNCKRHPSARRLKVWPPPSGLPAVASDPISPWRYRWGSISSRVDLRECGTEVVARVSPPGGFFDRERGRTHGWGHPRYNLPAGSRACQLLCHTHLDFCTLDYSSHQP